jgi:class 3 adenylate cyclase
MPRAIAYYVLIIFCFLTQLLVSQNQNKADSLIAIYNSGNSENEGLKELEGIVKNETNLDTKLQYSEFLINKGSESNKLDILLKGYSYKGDALQSKGDYVDANNAYFKSLKYANQLKDQKSIGRLTISIANTYSMSGNSDNAALYYDKGIAIIRKLDDPTSLGSALLNAGDEYFNNGNYVKALAYFNESGAIFEKIDYLIGKAYNLGNVGMVYAELGQDELAKNNMNEAIMILEELEDYYPISVYLTYLADIYAKKNDLPTAIDYAERSLHLATLYGLKDQISEANLKLSELYEKAENPQTAFSHYKSHIVYRDSVKNLETIEKMANSDIAQQMAQNDLLIQQKKNQRIIVYATILATILISFLAYGLFKRYRFIRKTNVIIELERNRSDQLLLNILPEQTALELKNNGKVEARRFESVTVLFTDFKGFSSNAEQLSPEELVESVDFYFTKFDAIIEKFGLEKIKTVGDSYMCAAGLPFPIKNHAHKMVLAAMEIADFVNNIKVQNPNSKTHYDIRIGINTGPVVAGVVGIKKFAYDIWGDSVNIASRMESGSEPGKINISEFTYQHIKDSFDCEYRGEIEVKNRGMLKMYFVNQAIESIVNPINTDYPKAKILNS